MHTTCEGTYRDHNMTVHTTALEHKWDSNKIHRLICCISVVTLASFHLVMAEYNTCLCNIHSSILMSSYDNHGSSHRTQDLTFPLVWATKPITICSWASDHFKKSHTFQCIRLIKVCAGHEQI